MINRLKHKFAGQTIAQGSEKSRRSFGGRIAALISRSSIGDDDWDELEDLLISGDVGPAFASSTVDILRRQIKEQRITTSHAMHDALRVLLANALDVGSSSLASGRIPTVVLVVGVNGSGKTTSVARIAHSLKRSGFTSVLAAADTFRAGAIDQLKIWGDHLGQRVVAHQQGADPAAVAFDAFESAVAARADYLLIDTAGRLQTNQNLMSELDKIRRTISRRDDSAPHEVLLVLDSISGQNCLSQARLFGDAVNLTGIVLAKLDSSAKGGVAFAITNELQVPIKFIGTGESIEDLAVFDRSDFVDALLKREL